MLDNDLENGEAIMSRSDSYHLRGDTVNGKQNISKLIEVFLCDFVGDKFRFRDLIDTLDIPENRIHAANQKIAKLKKEGKLIALGRGVYKVTELILNRQKLNQKKYAPNSIKNKQSNSAPTRGFSSPPDNANNNFNSGIQETIDYNQQAQTNISQRHSDAVNSLVPQARKQLEREKQIKAAQPLDVGETAQLLIDIDEQNKLYRNALEQVRLILEQAGIIQVVK